jgi:hypothetical protein
MKNKFLEMGPMFLFASMMMFSASIIYKNSFSCLIIYLVLFIVSSIITIIAALMIIFPKLNTEFENKKELEMLMTIILFLMSIFSFFQYISS